MSDYDAPFFKILSRNDTGETGGHQGGIVIPRDLALFFPHLAIGSGSTNDHAVIAELFDGAVYVGSVETRYQIQTWRHTRTPEHRLTRNLRPLLHRASAGDIVMFERQIGETDRYKLTLVRRTTPEYTRLSTGITGRSGLVSDVSPATQEDFRVAATSIQSDLEKPFVPFENNPQMRLTLVQRRTRTELFKHDVRLAYEYQCALCGNGLMTPSELPEVEAAHIIPRQYDGTNDPRNGLALCKTHHWAFDRYLWTIDERGKILVPRKVRTLRPNRNLAEVIGRSLAHPKAIDAKPAAEALTHHRNATIRVWEE